MKNKCAFFIALKFLISLGLLGAFAGCSTSDGLTKEMDKVYSSFKGGLTEEEEKNRTEKTSLVARQYLPVGMKLSDALILLHGDGFEIFEYRHHGFRQWPDQNYRPYEDEEFKNVVIKSNEVVAYFAKNRFKDWVLLNKEAIVKITSKDGNIISNIEGHIVFNTI